MGPELQSSLQRIDPAAIKGRVILVARCVRFGARSLASGYLDFAWSAVRAARRVGYRSIIDGVLGADRVQCNICGWTGNRFYPDVGPGYDELETVCPGCRCQDRHRALVVVLEARTSFFLSGSRVIEVAPMRNFQRFCLAQSGVDYISFDLRRFAMEKGDITRMRYEDESADCFLALHVLEHIPEEAAALAEIRRVLKPGGTAILQVPLFPDVAHTYEYEKPDPREVGHVRRYGRDFGERIAGHGFEVEEVSVEQLVNTEIIQRFGLSRDSFFLARKPVG